MRHSSDHDFQLVHAVAMGDKHNLLRAPARSTADMTVDTRLTVVGPSLPARTRVDKAPVITPNAELCEEGAPLVFCLNWLQRHTASG